MICGMCLRKQLVSKSTPLRTFATTASSLQHSTRPLKLAIIGAGPSGFYAASRLLSLLPADSPEGAKVQVDMYERLPTPYGLARYGVAPDHPEVKNCQHKFDELSTDSRFRYFGNTSIGTQSSSSSTSTSPITSLSTYTYPHALHVPLSSLIPHYTSILFTYGSSLSNPLSSVPGSSSSQNPLDDVFPALALVGWYNGHPAFRHNAPDLSRTTEVSIIGHGNVALDVARILLKPVETLSETDLPEEVLDVLAKSKVRSVRVVGRRGPAQVAFTAKEFREMSQIGLHRAGLDPKLATEARSIVGRDRARNRILDLMEKPWSASGDGKEFHLDFLKSPKSFNAASESASNDRTSRVGSVTWSVNELLTTAADPPSPPQSQTESSPRPSPTVIARPTDETVTTPADLVVESVGYRSEPLGSEESWTLPFDRSRGRVRNVGGRIVDEEGMVVPGLYAAGWVARGPVGVIASTMHDAYSLVSIMIDDHLNTAQTSIGVPQLGSNLDSGLPDLVEAGLKEGKVVTLDGWHKIDAAEVERARGAKPREKFTKVEDMLAVLS